MSDRLVTLATYRFAFNAELAARELGQHGFEAFVADANLVTADYFLGSAVGFIKLQAASSQAEAALAFLNEHPELLDQVRPEDADAGGPDKCLACREPMAEETERCAACGWSYGGAGAEDVEPA